MSEYFSMKESKKLLKFRKWLEDGL